MSITLAAARLGAILGNIIFGVFVDVACAIPILLVATLLICKLNLFILFYLTHINLCHDIYVYINMCFLQLVGY